MAHIIRTANWQVLLQEGGTDIQEIFKNSEQSQKTEILQMNILTLSIH